jgi:hypothetical protein
MQRSRSKAIALVAAGAFTVATATGAAAATWPSGPSGSTAGRADEAVGAMLTVSGQALRLQLGQQSPASQALQADQMRDLPARLAAANWKTAHEQAAKKAAAARAAAAALAAAQSSAQASAAAQQAPTVQLTPAVPAASGSPQQIAEAMLASFGWSSGQFSCLDPLWAHESGWSVTAENPDGAYGIPQALPGSKMASAGPNWPTSATTQIKWGLEYIKGTYGSPCAAWEHELATGWY